MYNHTRSDEEGTLARLALRSAAFYRTADVSDEESLQSFRNRWEEASPIEKLLSGLPNCPFLGLLDYDEASDKPASAYKVGCMVHPAQNDGIDGRDCGVYDRHTCEEYLCGAHDLLGDREKLMIVRAIDDSYLYGLIITDVLFVRQLFEQAARINGMEPPERRLDTKAAIEAAGDYFELKRDWPYAAADGVFGQMRPGRGLTCDRRDGPSAALGVEPGPFEMILTCLATEVEDLEALDDARSRVRARVEAFAAAVAL